MPWSLKKQLCLRLRKLKKLKLNHWYCGLMMMYLFCYNTAHANEWVLLGMLNSIFFQNRNSNKKKSIKTLNSFPVRTGRVAVAEHPVAWWVDCGGPGPTPPAKSVRHVGQGILGMWLLTDAITDYASEVADWLYDRSGTENIAIIQLGGCIVLAYSVIAWGILCSRREDSGVAVQATAMRHHL